MPFKIVQTIENEKILLTVVPSKWERDKPIYWPIRRNEVNLIHDGNSCPKPEWKTPKCEVKREFATYAEANEALEIVEQKSDTDFTNSEKAYKNVIKEEDNISPLQLECFSQDGEIILEVQGENNAESAIITVEVDKALDIHNSCLGIKLRPTALILNQI